MNQSALSLDVLHGKCDGVVKGLSKVIENCLGLLCSAVNEIIPCVQKPCHITDKSPECDYSKQLESEHHNYVDNVSLVYESRCISLKTHAQSQNRDITCAQIKGKHHYFKTHLGSLFDLTRLTKVSISDAVMCFSKSFLLL